MRTNSAANDSGLGTLVLVRSLGRVQFMQTVIQAGVLSGPLG
jgi:hypothetical protein